MTDAILISANLRWVDMDDASRHLEDHKELYWSVGFQIDKHRLSFPVFVFIHISGGQVEYRARVNDILPFSETIYKDAALSERVMPQAWRDMRQQEKEEAKPKRNTLVMTEIVPFSLDTRLFEKPGGGRVTLPPYGYVRVIPPNEPSESPPTLPPKVSLAEKNLEDFIAQQLDKIEPGLRLVERQLSTPAGRLDLLCQDAHGSYVVVELKRMRGSDQVVGQTLRYMGWVKEAHPQRDVRGIVIVGKEDEALRYAIKTVPSIQAKVFVVDFAPIV